MNPNVLLVQVDQMNARCLGGLGNPNLRTPNLDALAAEGTIFTSAHCQSPICMPSRASMISGQYPSTTRVFGFDGLGCAGSPRIQSTFKQAGYRTGAFGKFHLHNIAPHEWDMDVAAATCAEDEALARPADNTYMDWCRANGHTWPCDQTHSHIPPRYSDSWSGPRVNPEPDAPPEEWYRSATPLKSSLETYTTDRCLEFLGESDSSDQPFFAWLTYDRPHIPVYLPQPWFDRMCEKDIELPPAPTAEELGTLPRWMIDQVYDHPEYSRAGLGPERFEKFVAAYYTLIEFLDAEAGRVIQELDALNLSENTIIVFTSDHGDQAGWGGVMDKQPFSASDAITRVPLIIRPAPALGPSAVGRRIDDPVELIDLYPTLSALAGIASPEAVEGVDLSGVVLGKDEADRDRAVVCEELFTRSLTHRKQKLVFHTREENCMLFDLETDPDGFHNRYDDPAYRDVRFGLKRKLLAFLCERVFGPWDKEDVDRVERAMDPEDDRPGLFVFDMPACEGLHNHRAAVIYYDGRHHLLVPFYERDPSLFGARFVYGSWDDALPFDLETAEPLLDEAVRACMRSVLPASRLEVERPAEPHVDPAAIAELHRRLSNKPSGE